MPLSSKYLNLSLMKPFCSSKLKYLIMSSSDVKGTETVEVLLAILKVILVTYRNSFFRKKFRIFLLKLFSLKPNL